MSTTHLKTGRVLTPFAAVALASGIAAPSAIASVEDAKPWQFDTSLNLFLAGMSGDITAQGIPASLDASFGDILDHLEASVAGRVTVHRDRWFVSTEFSYLRLSAAVPLASAELEQWLVEPSVGYSFCQTFAAYVGARYNNLSGEVLFNGPAGRTSIGSQDWWDPVLGALFRFPLIGDQFSVEGRLDVGGFGAGADLTWQAHPFLNWQFTRSASLQLGYRWLGTDYETGSGPTRFRYDVVVQGPQIGFSYRF